MFIDEEYIAKISYFRTLKAITINQTHLTTQVKVTFGYFVSEYFWSGQYTEKKWCLWLGMVLVKLMSGQNPVFSTSPIRTKSLAIQLITLMEDRRPFDILDVRIKYHCYNEVVVVVVVVSIAKRCLNLEGRNQPAMRARYPRATVGVCGERILLWVELVLHIIIKDSFNS